MDASKRLAPPLDYTSFAMKRNFITKNIRKEWCALLLGLNVQAAVWGMASQDPHSHMDARRLNNLGVAYMNQQISGKALELFRQAIAADETLAVPHLNAGIALLSSQNAAEARVQLERAAKLDPINPRIWYNLGLLERVESNPEAAQHDFARTLGLDPANADAHYFLGSILIERNDFLRAIPEFVEALRLSPLHASAEFGLARALQRSGSLAEARKHLERFQYITQEKLSSPMGQSYGEQGTYALAEEIKPSPLKAGPMIPVLFSATRLSDSKTDVRPTPVSGDELQNGICLIDLDGHGKPDLIVLNDGGEGVGFYRHTQQGGYQREAATPHGLQIDGRTVGCAVGDFDNDGHPDLVITTTDRLILYQNRTDDTFRDVTERAGLKTLNRPSGVTFIDFDHDGDLDLLVAGSSSGKGSGANVLWRNNGNQTFSEWTEQAGLRGDESTVTAMLSDINNDRAIDILTAGISGVSLYLNQREGPFLRLSLYPKGEFPAALGVAILDFNKDGWMDIAVTHNGAPGVTLWRNVDGKRFERVALPPSDVTRALGLTPIDFDNDGWIDLAVVVETAHGIGVRLLRNVGAGNFQDISTQAKLDKIPIAGARSLVAVDDDGDGDADLLVSTSQGGPLLLQNAGGNLNHSLQIVLHGLADNKMALGTKVEVFSGGSWQKWEIAGASGFLSQGAPGILVGLGGSAQPDVVRMLWPTGVPQDEVEPVANGVLELTELDRRGSSCPILFAWNGKEYEFITDTIGAAVIGHWIAPNIRNTPDPDEWIKIAGSQLKPYHGFLSLRFGEPMEEVNYLDKVKLVAIDHPSASEVFPNERFMADPPFVDAKTVVARSAHPPLAAWDDAGNDVTSLIREQDHQYLKNFTNLSFAGFTNTHSVTLDLGEWSPSKPLRLLMSGYIEYFTADSLYASSQAGIVAVSPYVEARLPDGTWKRVVDDMGFPAGLPRTMIADLSRRLPAGTRQIRITTNLQIYWDQILVSDDADTQGLITETEIPLASASLAFRGYPKQIERETPGDLTYRYNDASATGPFIHQRGMHTRYGDVTPLLKAVDDKFAIFGSGEDIDLEFDSTALPALPEGWKRDYFFYANGYVKDMDYYEAMPFTVSAMPFHGMSGYPYTEKEHFPDTAESLDYQLQWNSRMESDLPRTSYKFEYQPRIALPDIAH